MDVHDLAVKYLMGDMNDAQLAYWLSVNNISAEDFVNVVDAIKVSQQTDSLMWMAVMIAAGVAALVFLFN